MVPQENSKLPAFSNAFITILNATMSVPDELPIVSFCILKMCCGTELALTVGELRHVGQLNQLLSIHFAANTSQIDKNLMNISLDLAEVEDPNLCKHL
jgi:hypothetical protein